MGISSIKSRLVSAINGAKFYPTVVGFFTNPFYIIRKSLFEGIKSQAHLVSGKTLDFGCGSKPYELLFAHSSSYIGCDIEVSGHNHASSSVDVYYDGRTLPFEAQSFDSVVSFETFEHIFNIEIIVKELNRILKKDGRILLTIPFVWEEHEVPYDYARYSTYGIRHILESNGFEVIVTDRLGDYVDVIAQLLIAYFVGMLNSEKAKTLLTVVIQPPIVLAKVIAQIILPRSSKLFLNTLVVARKI